LPAPGSADGLTTAEDVIGGLATAAQVKITMAHRLVEALTGAL